MASGWRSLDPWCRELRGVIEAVPAMSKDVDTSVERRFIGCSRQEDLWELRVALPRLTHCTRNQWIRGVARGGEVAGPQEHNYSNLRVIREALDLLWLVRSIDESAWLWLLVNCCGVGGDEVSGWSEDARILPVLRIQPPHAATIEDLVVGAQQCGYLLVSLQDDGARSREFHETKHELLASIRNGSVSCGSGYRVHWSSWMVPQMQLSASESDTFWTQLRRMLRRFNQETTPVGYRPWWRVQSIDIHALRFLITVDVAAGILDLVRSGIQINELWVDLRDHAEDQLTANGFAAMLRKLFASGGRPRSLRVDCENATLNRLGALEQLLDLSSSACYTTSLERFGMGSTNARDRSTRFQWLGKWLLAHACANSCTLRLDIPDLSLADVASITKGYGGSTSTNCNDGPSVGISSLVLHVDCHKESWPATAALLRLIGSHLTSLEFGINGGSQDETQVDSLLDTCPHLDDLTLHGVCLATRNPLVSNHKTRRLRSLVLFRFVASPELLCGFASAIEKPTHLESLHLDLRELVAVDTRTIKSFTTALHHNRYLSTLTMTLDHDAVAMISDEVYDAFVSHHNVLLYQPVRLDRKLAFLSVALSRDLSLLPLTMIFQFAATKTRQQATIRGPVQTW